MNPDRLSRTQLRYFQPDLVQHFSLRHNRRAYKGVFWQIVLEPESAICDPADDPLYVNLSFDDGFAKLFPVLDYLTSAVATFLALHSPLSPDYSGWWPIRRIRLIHRSVLLKPVPTRFSSGEGQGGLDMVAVGDNIAVYADGNYTPSGATSASTPIFASIVNRLVEERLAMSKGPLSFSKAALFAEPWALKDIVEGPGRTAAH